MVKNTNNDRAFAQVTMPDWMFEAWGNYAKEEGIEKQYLLERFIKQFIKTRKSYVLNKNDMDNIPKYLVLHVPPPNSKSRSLWISKPTYELIEAFIKETDYRVNRIIFSALLEGLVNGNKIRI